MTYRIVSTLNPDGERFASEAEANASMLLIIQRLEQEGYQRTNLPYPITKDAQMRHPNGHLVSILLRS